MSNELQQEAQKWLAQGISPIPILPNSKIAARAWATWQHKQPLPVVVKVWFKDEHLNMGLVCGRLVVLDFDNLDRYSEWRNLMPAMAGSYTVQTPRPGIHVYFLSAQSVATKIKVVSGLDVKASGGYVLAPPSRVNGKAYQVVQDAQIISVDGISDLLPTAWAAPTEKPSIDKSSSTRTSAQLYRGLADKIKSQLRIEDYARQYTQLRPSSRNGRFLMGVCPVHNDHDPSFVVDTVNQKCFCYGGCRLNDPRGLDIIDLYQTLNHVTLNQALYQLGDGLGLIHH